MIFNSVTFICFLVLVVSLYWCLPSPQRLWMLLIASCAFYGFWRWEFLSVMFASALTDYFTALAIDRTPAEQKSTRRALLSITLIVNLGLLVYFKYLFFLTSNFNTLIALTSAKYHVSLPEIILPLGISFYTFETISYTVDVYRGIIPAEKSFLNYALFVTFFPKLVAGPIQRAAELLTQLKNRPRFDLDDLSRGVTRILYGLFLKVVIADNISPLVDEGFAMPAAQLSALDVWTLAFLFGLQIYFDFSAYSHIALGSAKLMGINIPENFNFPYSATSFKDFWRRWHISLSSWIRDYVYLPASGVRVSRTTAAGGIGQSLERERKSAHRNISLFATWAVMGLWHGANWTYVVWGLYHAVMIFIERVGQPLRGLSPVFRSRIAGWLFTVPPAMLGWIVFRAVDLHQAMTLMSQVFRPGAYRHLNFRENTYLVAASLFSLTIVAYFAERLYKTTVKKAWLLRSMVDVPKLAILIVFVFVFLRPIRQYIYFQF